MPSSKPSPLDQATALLVSQAKPQRRFGQGSVLDMIGDIGRDAASNAESLGRGALSVIPGTAGDLEKLARLLANVSFGPGGVEVPMETYLPTSEEVKAKIPRISRPTAEAEGMEDLGGALNMTGPIDATRAVVKAGRKAAPHILNKAGQMLEQGAMGQGALSPLMAAAAPMNVVKPKGGNWLGGVDKQLNRMKMADTVSPEKMAEDIQAIETAKRIMGDDPTAQRAIAQMENELEVSKRNNAINKWVDSNLSNYIKKEMGTPEDPVRKLAEQGVLHIKPYGDLSEVSERLKHKRIGSMFPPLGMGKSEAAKFWEKNADISIEPNSAGSYKHGSLDESILRNNPWLQKVPDEEMVYYAKGLNDLGFDHIIDVLRQDVREGRIRPEQLSKVSMEQAVRRVYEFDQEQARKMAEAQIKATEGMPIHKEYPEGYKWIELTPEPEDVLRKKHEEYVRKDFPDIEKYDPWGFEQYVKDSMNSSRVVDQQKLADALKYEGDTMGHCVGGYCPDVLEGRSRIFSLRDKKGEPHVTIETQPNKHLDFNTWWDKQPEELRDEINARARRGEHNFSVFEAPEYLAARSELPPVIAQIKGKQNRAPKEEYLPYVQDFVRSGEWSDVGDLHNTGLKTLDQSFDDYDMAKSFNRANPKTKYLTYQEIDDFTKQWNESSDGQKNGGAIVANRMKKGGKVHISDNCDCMRMELQDQKFGVGGIAERLAANLTKNTAKNAAKDLNLIKQAGREAHQSQAANRAAINEKVGELMSNLPPRSKKANLEAGLYHPVGGGIKLSRPVHGMHETTVPDPMFNPPNIGIITPEQMVKERAAFFPLVGDRAAGGRYLTHIDENELEKPVRLTAGPLYMDANYDINPNKSAAWESGLGRVTALSRQAERAGQDGRPVYGIYTAGSGTNTDFNVMGANALLQQIPFSKITKKSEKAFDNAMREGTKEFAPLPDWPGIRSPNVEAYLLDKSNGIARTKLFGTMGKDTFQSLGFPDVPATRKAIIEPELLDVPTNQAGFRMALMDTTGRIIENPTIPSDYPVSMAGQVAGKLDVPTDYKNLWQSFFDARRLLGKPESGDYYGFSRAHPIQYADDEWLNRLMEARYSEAMKNKEGKYKKGGPIKVKRKAKKVDPAIKKVANNLSNIFKNPPSMAAGGGIDAHDLEIEERPL